MICRNNGFSKAKPLHVPIRTTLQHQEEKAVEEMAARGTGTGGTTEAHRVARLGAVMMTMGTVEEEGEETMVEVTMGTVEAETMVVTVEITMAEEETMVQTTEVTIATVEEGTMTVETIVKTGEVTMTMVEEATMAMVEEATMAMAEEATMKTEMGTIEMATKTTILSTMDRIYRMKILAM
jgi:hypothetical protein